MSTLLCGPLPSPPLPSPPLPSLSLPSPPIGSSVVPLVWQAAPAEQTKAVEHSGREERLTQAGHWPGLAAPVCTGHSGAGRHQQGERQQATQLCSHQHHLVLQLLHDTHICSNYMGVWRTSGGTVLSSTTRAPCPRDRRVTLDKALSVQLTPSSRTRTGRVGK